MILIIYGIFEIPNSVITGNHKDSTFSTLKYERAASYTYYYILYACNTVSMSPSMILVLKIRVDVGFPPPGIATHFSAPKKY